MLPPKETKTKVSLLTYSSRFSHSRIVLARHARSRVSTKKKFRFTTEDLRVVV